MEPEKLYTTAWLLNLIESGEAPEFLLFWGHRAKPNTVTQACFSQWWPSRFSVDGLTYETAEHWMMIVIEGNLHKFKQNEDLKDFLLATRGKVLVEASPVDAIWGIGLARDHEDALCPTKWRGPNLLGYALMTVRDMLEV